MRLSGRALAIAAGLLWGGAILLVGLVHLAGASYGSAFLQTISSVYPGFHASRTLGDVLVGTAYGLVDGGLGGLLLAWLYNVVAGRRVST
jgi:hypothetical protein